MDVDQGSGISPDTLRAYQETEYGVQAHPPFVLRIGQASADLAALHKARGVACSAFVTASNPRSRLLGTDENAARRARLMHELEGRGWPFIDGVGRHPTGSWPGEESFLILGMALDEARELGREFDQNAIVWAGADAVPQLVMLPLAVQPQAVTRVT